MLTFDQPRPPARLWLLHPDHSGSFPSGTTTTAVVILLVAGFVAWRARPLVRTAVITLGVLFALAVGVSRLYLGDHYPTDVAGSYLTVLAAVLVVSALSDLGWVRRLAAVVLRTPEITADSTSRRAPPQPATSSWPSALDRRGCHRRRVASTGPG